MMNRHFAYTHPGQRGIQPGYLTEEEIGRFNVLARSSNLLSQREFDEMEAGRRFANAREWIEHTLRSKGEGSHRKLMVRVRGQRKECFYTQTRDYHIPGGEDLIRKSDGSWGCEDLVVYSGDLALHQADHARACALQAVVASVKQQSDPHSTSGGGEVRQSRILPGLPSRLSTRSTEQPCDTANPGVPQTVLSDQTIRAGTSSWQTPQGHNSSPPGVRPVDKVDDRVSTSGTSKRVELSPANSSSSSATSTTKSSSSSSLPHRVGGLSRFDMKLSRTISPESGDGDRVNRELYEAMFPHAVIHRS